MSYKGHSVTDDDTTGYDPVLTVHASTLEGDEMVALIATVDNDPDATPSTPGGWALQQGPIETGDGGSPPALWIYTKTASAADESGAGSDTYTWTFSGEQQWGMMILADPASWGEYGANTNGSAVTIDAPSVTTTVADELVFFIGLKSVDNFWDTLPAGLDAQLAHDLIGSATETHVGGFATIAVYRNEYAGTGATGAKTFAFTVQAADDVIGVTFSLAPDAVGNPWNYYAQQQIG